MENILINFTSDPSGLQPGIDGLVQMEVVDKQVAEQAKKTAAEMQKRDKAVVDGTKSAQASLEKLTTGFKGLDKSIVGGAYTKALKQLQKDIDSTGDEFKQLALVIDFAKKKMEGLSPDSTEWKELNAEIKAGEQILAEFGDTQGKGEGKTQSFKARLRELKAEMQQLEDAGQDDTEAFQKMAIEAARLEDQIGDTQARVRAMASDTANMDAAVQGLQTLTAGFGIAQGAAALFGGENDKVQQALLKLNAVMAISNSIREIQNALQAQSIIRIKAEAIGQGVLATSTRLTGSAFAFMGVAVEATSVAFKVLRAAIITTGIGALVVGIGFLIEKISEWTSSTESAIDKQKRLADATRGLNEAIVEQNGLFVDAISDGKKILEDQLSKLQASGGSHLAQLDLRRRIAEEDKKIGQQSLDNLGLTQASLQLKENDYNRHLAVLQQLNQQALNDTTKEQKEATQKLIENTKAEMDSLKPIIDAGRAAVEQIFKGQQDSEAVIAETQRTKQENALKSATAYAEARVLIAKAGSQQELNAQIDAIRVREHEDLANVNLTEGERFKIHKQAEKQIRDLRFSYEKKALEDAKTGVDAQVILAKEGSREQLDFKLKSLDLARDIELKDQELTDNKRLEIESRFQKERQDMINSFNRKVAEDAINTRVSELQAQNAALALSSDASTNAQLLENKKQLLDDEAALEVLSINESEKNEELRRAKIKAVYAKMLADKEQLERDKNKADIDAGLTEAKSINDSEIAKQQLILKSSKATERQKQDAQAEVFRWQQANLDAEARANQAAYDDGLISFDTFLQKKRDLKTQSDELEAAQEEAHQQKMTQVRELAQQTALNLMNFAFSNAKAGYAAEEAKIKELYDQKRISETEYNNRLKTIRRKQAQDEKAQALFTTLVNQGPTILKGFQQGGFAGVAAAFTLFFSLLSSLQGTEVPQFYKGTKKAPAGFKWVGEKGPELIYDKGGYPIIPHEKSMQIAATGYASEPVAREYGLPMPTHGGYTVTMPDLPEYSNSSSTAPQIDYEKLGEVIAQKMAENPSFSLSLDENGFNLSVHQGNEQINYVNKKLTI